MDDLLYELQRGKRAGTRAYNILRYGAPLGEHGLKTAWWLTRRVGWLATAGRANIPMGYHWRGNRPALMNWGQDDPELLGGVPVPPKYVRTRNRPDIFDLNTNKFFDGSRVAHSYEWHAKLARYYSERTLFEFNRLLDRLKTPHTDITETNYTDADGRILAPVHTLNPPPKCAAFYDNGAGAILNDAEGNPIPVHGHPVGAAFYADVNGAAITNHGNPPRIIPVSADQTPPHDAFTYRYANNAIINDATGNPIPVFGPPPGTVGYLDAGRPAAGGAAAVPPAILNDETGAAIAANDHPAGAAHYIDHYGTIIRAAPVGAAAVGAPIPIIAGIAPPADAVGYIRANGTPIHAVYTDKDGNQKTELVAPRSRNDPPAQALRDYVWYKALTSKIEKYRNFAHHQLFNEVNKRIQDEFIAQVKREQTKIINKNVKKLQRKMRYVELVYTYRNFIFGISFEIENDALKALLGMFIELLG